MTNWIVSGVFGFIGGGAVVWFFKEPLLLWYKGAEDRIGDLNDAIQKIREKL